MARMTEPLIKWRSDGKWRGQYSGQEFSDVEEKGGETWRKVPGAEPGEIVHINPCGKGHK